MTPFSYRCTDCGRQYPREQVRYLCPVCGEGYRPGIPLTGVLEAVFDYDAIRSQFQPDRPDWNLFCPVETAFHPPLPVGNTPMCRVDRLGAELGLGALWLLMGSLPLLRPAQDAPLYRRVFMNINLFALVLTAAVILDPFFTR